jgi:FHS family glucose/mannose:H+ symporter-like MFS transporter
VIPARATAGAFGAFVLIGAVQAFYGPALPAFGAAFGASPAAAGLVLSAHFLGGIAGVLGAGAAQGRVAPRVPLAAGLLLVSAGCVAVAAAPAWVAVVAAAGVVGAGFGALDVGFNTLFASGFGGRSAAMLNLLNAAFGLGAVLGPLAVGVAAGGGFRSPFAVTGAAGLALLPLVLALPGDRKRPAPAAAPDGRAGSRALAAAFVLLYVLYVGAETGVGAWEPTHLAALGWDAARAASLTSAYWAALTVGRVLIAPVSLRVPAERLVLATLGLAAAALAAAHVDPLAPAAYALAGLALAPVFPTGLVWLDRALPGARGLTALVLAGAMVGGIVFPPVVGRLVGAAGPEAVPTALAAIAGAALAVAAALRRATGARPQPGRSAT